MTSQLAAIYDIHGNLPALLAVLAETQQLGVSQIVVGGDVIPGPQPVEAIDALMDLPISAHFICGNGEREILALLDRQETSVPAQSREMMAWVAAVLEPRHVRFIRTWQPSTTLDLSTHGKTLFCHATPQNDTDVFTVRTPESQVAAAFANLAASTVVCAHTHMQFDRRIGKLRVINAGSVGMSFDGPGAYWLLMGSTIELRRTEYDLLSAAAEIRATGYPQSDVFAADHVLAPPSRSLMEERFEIAAYRCFPPR